MSDEEYEGELMAHDPSDSSAYPYVRLDDGAWVVFKQGVRVRVRVVTDARLISWGPAVGTADDGVQPFQTPNPR